MPRRKKKKSEPKLSRGKPISPVLIKARNLRASLLRRISPELKETTPTINKLFSWLSLPVYMCYYCLKPIEFENITIDHMQPLNRGGNNELMNLCVSCNGCNAVKGNLTESEYRSLFELVKTWDEEVGRNFFGRIKNGFFR